MLRACVPLVLAGLISLLPAAGSARQDVKLPSENPDASVATDLSAREGGKGGGKGAGDRGGGGKADRGGGRGGGGKADRGGGRGGGGKADRGGGGGKAFRGGDRPRFDRGGRGDGPRREGRRDRGPRFERVQPRQQRQQRQERAGPRDRGRDEMRALQSRQRELLRERRLDRASRERLRLQQRRERQELRARQDGERRKDAQERPRRQNLLTEEQRQKREEARRQRAERRAQRLRERSREERADRRDRRRLSDDEARRSRFAGHRDRGERRGRDFSRRAWRDGRRAAFVAWVGPLFLPYIYADLFDYTFFPYAYERGYWDYVYDDFFDSMFWAYGSPYAAPGYAAPLPRGPGPVRLSPQTRRAVAQLCEPARGLTAWPLERIERAVAPNEEQRKLLEVLRQATRDADSAFKNACRTDFALTPPGRVSAMISRIEATLETLRILRPPLEAFYTSLSDEQKERFNRIGPEIGATEARAARNRTASVEDSNACRESKAGLATAPIDRIEDVVRPTEAQRAAFQKLNDAAQEAIGLLQAACSDQIALTPTGRLEAMQTHLEAMLDAAETVQPALEEFYAALSSEQKARFNALGREARR